MPEYRVCIYPVCSKVNRGNSVRNSTTFGIIAATFTPHVANSTKLPPAKQLSYSWLHIEFGDSNINIFENNNIFLNVLQTYGFSLNWAIPSRDLNIAMCQLTGHTKSRNGEMRNGNEETRKRRNDDEYLVRIALSTSLGSNSRVRVQRQKAVLKL